MKLWKVLFFQVKLVISLATFVFQVGLVYGKQHKSLAVSLVIFIFVVFGLVGKLSSAPTLPQENSPTLELSLFEFHQQPMNNTELLTAIQQNQKFLEKQPSARDVLLDTALLYYSAGDTNLATKYWQKARETDPNNPIFDQELF